MRACQIDLRRRQLLAVTKNERQTLQHMPSSHYAIFRELETLTCGEIQSSKRLVELMLAKVNLLDQSQFSDQRCEAIARTFLDIVKDVLSERYQNFSIRAFVHVCVALDYFLDPLERIPDAETGGFRDDLELLVNTEIRFKREIQKYLEWKTKTGAEHAF